MTSSIFSSSLSALIPSPKFASPLIQPSPVIGPRTPFLHFWSSLSPITTMSPRVGSTSAFRFRFGNIIRCCHRNFKTSTVFGNENTFTFEWSRQVDRWRWCGWWRHLRLCCRCVSYFHVELKSSANQALHSNQASNLSWIKQEEPDTTTPSPIPHTVMEVGNTSTTETQVTSSSTSPSPVNLSTSWQVWCLIGM
jgi:hypothetical protein